MKLQVDVDLVTFLRISYHCGNIEKHHHIMLLLIKSTITYTKHSDLPS